MKEPVSHIERPQLPWRAGEPGLTECGLSAVQVKTMTRTDFVRKLKEWGEQRTALLTCMTCCSTANRYLTWEQDPRQALQRELDWEGYGRGHDNTRGTRCRDELRAMALLIARYPGDFAECLNQVRNAIDFQAARRKRDRH